MSRFAHYLRGNKSVQLPANAIWFDTETHQIPVADDAVEHRLWFGWACFSRLYDRGKWTEPEWFRFETASSFWDWVWSKTRSKTRLYLFAHNLLFDARVLEVFTHMLAEEWFLSRSIVEGPPSILVWRQEDRTIEMLDTLNWWRVPLQTLGDRVGLPKLPFPTPDASTETWDTYCKRDVEVLRRTLFGWWDFLAGYDLGGFARTLAGQAFRTYRHRFMDSEIFIDTNEKSLVSARASYYGGRTECFYIGRYEAPVRVYDVNSMYPSVMATEEYPTEHVSFIRHPTWDELERWVEKYAVCGIARVRTSRPAYPVRLDGKLVFPIGTFETALSTPELVTALEHDELVGIRDVALYKKAHLFERFVDELFQHRLKATERGDEVERYLLKILMNSLYGKFGQRGHVWERVGDAEDDSIRRWKELDVETGHVYQWRQYGGVLEQLQEEPEGIESHPAIAAHVTAYARMLLWSTVERCGRENVLYCDTDSLTVSEAAWTTFEGMEDATALGSWALEHEAPWIHIHGPKDYMMPEKSRTKGVKRNARWLDGSTVQQEQWDSFRASVRDGSYRLPQTRKVVKRLKRQYDKGIVTPSGIVEPLRLAER